MSVWATPITWVNGAVTAANMNTISTNLTWLKSAIDLITNTTASDTGTSTNLRIVRATAGAVAFETKVSGEGGERFNISTDGDLAWGSGGGTPAEMIQYVNGGLQVDRPMVHAAGSPMRFAVKAGTPTDADVDASFTGGLSGFAIWDQTNKKLYIRDSAVWRQVTLV